MQQVATSGCNVAQPALPARFAFFSRFILLVMGSVEAEAAMVGEGKEGEISH